VKFGAMVATKIDDWQLLQYAESLGYEHGWIPDSQMIWSDCYATMALAAWHTSRIKLGTGVSIAPTRDPAVTAHSIASINRLAPGRVFLGMGTGHTAMRVMGHDPMPAPEFRRYLEVVRGLLHGEEVEHEYRGETRSIRFLHLEHGFIDIEHPIPIWVAANGPMALRATGALGDGRISAGDEPPEVIEHSLKLMQEGAAKIARPWPDDFHTACLTYGCVLEPGESIQSDRVIDEVGSMATALLHFWYENYRRFGDDSFVPAECGEEWQRYQHHVKEMETPEDRRFQQIHEGHCTFLVPEERIFVTENLIRASGGLVGTPDDIIDMIRERERRGLKEITLLPPRASARKIFKDFAEQVIARY